MKTLLLTTAIAVLFAAGAATADPCIATDPTILGNATTDDVTLNGTPSSQCEIVAGNSGQGGGTLLPLTGSITADDPLNPWMLLFHTDPTTPVTYGPVNGITFSDYQFDQIDAYHGTFGFSWTGGPAYIDFMFSMHAGTSGYFAFDELLLTPASGTAPGTWLIEWYNPSGQSVGSYSNAQFWARGGSSDYDQPTPEPGTLWLTGVALLAAGALTFRRA